MVFDLYKKRDFGSYISDTIQFFKKFWKNYFVNFISLNGVLLLILSVIYYFVFKDTLMNFEAGNTSDWMFTDQNFGISLTIFIIGFIIAIIFSIITIAYPIVYLRLVEQSTDRETFTASEIFNEIKADFFRILLFGLLSMFTFLPIFIIYFALSLVLSVLIIGIPLLIMGIGITMTWINQALYHYLNEEDMGFTEAMGAGWDTLFSNFWHISGTSTAMIFITSTLTGVVSMVPYFIGIFQLISTGNSGNSVDDLNRIMPWMIAFYVINIVFSYALNNFIYIQQGLIYYSSKEEDEQIMAYSEIESIGNHEE